MIHLGDLDLKAEDSVLGTLIKRCGYAISQASLLVVALGHFANLLIAMALSQYKGRQSDGCRNWETDIGRCALVSSV